VRFSKICKHAKNHIFVLPLQEIMGGYETGKAWSKTGGYAPPARPKTATAYHMLNTWFIVICTVGPLCNGTQKLGLMHLKDLSGPIKCAITILSLLCYKTLVLEQIYM